MGLLEKIQKTCGSTASGQDSDVAQPNREISAESSLTQRRTWSRTSCIPLLAVETKNTN